MKQNFLPSGWSMGNDDITNSPLHEIKQEIHSPPPTPAIEEPTEEIKIVSSTPPQTDSQIQTSNLILNALNGTKQVMVSAGNKMVPIRGILLKPVNSAGTTTLISVPVSLTSNGTNLQTVTTTAVKHAVQEKPCAKKEEKIYTRIPETSGVSRVGIFKATCLPLKFYVCSPFLC